jgi:hypothetical protein
MKTLIGLALLLMLVVVVWSWVSVPDRPRKDPRSYCDNIERPNPICDGGLRR